MRRGLLLVAIGAGILAVAYMIVTSNLGVGVQRRIVFEDSLAVEPQQETLRIELSGTNSSQFSTYNNCNQQRFSETCNVFVNFAPTSAGTATANLEVSEPNGGHVIGLVTGKGTVELPSIAPSISSLSNDFGEIQQGSVSDSFTFSITNTAAYASPVIYDRITDPDGDQFIMILDNDADQFIISDDSCDGFTLPAGSSCKIAVAFAPTSSGPTSAHLEVYFSDETWGRSAALTGTGTLHQSTGARIIISPRMIDFGSVPLGTASKVGITITNDGQDTASEISTVLTGVNSNQFEISHNVGCSDYLFAGDSCTVVVTFAPTEPGRMTASIKVVAGETGPFTSILRGTASAPIIPVPAQIVMSPSSYYMGNVPFGSKVEHLRALVVNTIGQSPNIAIANISIQGSDQIKIGAEYCTGAIVGTVTGCTVDLILNANKTGLIEANVVVSAKDGSSASAKVTANIVQGDFSISPSAIEFASTKLGSSWGPLTFTIVNPTAWTPDAIGNDFDARWSISQNLSDNQPFYISVNGQPGMRLKAAVFDPANSMVTYADLGQEGTDEFEGIEVQPTTSGVYSLKLLNLGKEPIQTQVSVRYNDIAISGIAIAGVLSIPPGVLIVVSGIIVLFLDQRSLKRKHKGPPISPVTRPGGVTIIGVLTILSGAIEIAIGIFVLLFPQNILEYQTSYGLNVEKIADEVRVSGAWDLIGGSASAIIGLATLMGKGWAWKSNVVSSLNSMAIPWIVLGSSILFIPPSEREQLYPLSVVIPYIVSLNVIAIIILRYLFSSKVKLYFGKSNFSLKRLAIVDPKAARNLLHHTWIAGFVLGILFFLTGFRFLVSGSPDSFIWIICFILAGLTLGFASMTRLTRSRTSILALFCVFIFGTSYLMYISIEQLGHQGFWFLSVEILGIPLFQAVRSIPILQKISSI